MQRHVNSVQSVVIKQYGQHDGLIHHIIGNEEPQMVLQNEMNILLEPMFLHRTTGHTIYKQSVVTTGLKVNEPMCLLLKDGEKQSKLMIL